MTGLTLSFRKSIAEVSLDGAHVGRVSLDGDDVVKPSNDGSPTHGGIAVLIPYAGRVKYGRYTFDGIRYALPVAPSGHAIHGFAKDTRWEVAEEEAGSAKLRALLQGEGYPGLLEAEITYAVGATTFSTECAVKNVSRRDCPLTVGFHPYFLAGNWTLRASGRAYRYALADEYFPTGEMRRYDLRAAGPEASLDDVFKVEGTIRLRDSSRSLTITRRKMPFLVVFNGKYAEGRSVAVEPYTGLPDAYNNGIGLVRLEPGRAFACGYEISLSRPRRNTERCAPLAPPWFK